MDIKALSVEQLQQALDYLVNACPTVGHGDKRLELSIAMLSQGIDEIRQCRLTIADIHRKVSGLVWLHGEPHNEI